LLEFNDVLFKSFNLELCIFEAFEEFKGCLIGFVDLFILLKEIVRGAVKISLELVLLLDEDSNLDVRFSELSFNIDSNLEFSL